MSFTFAMKAEEVYAGLYKEALENIDNTEEVFYYLCTICGNIENLYREKSSICGVPEVWTIVNMRTTAIGGVLIKTK
jgi:rubrerythrin